MVCGNSMDPTFRYRDNEIPIPPFCLFCLFNSLLNVHGKQMRSFRDSQVVVDFPRIYLLVNSCVLYC